MPGAGVRAAASGGGLHPGRPHQRGPGRGHRGVAEMAVALMFAVNRFVLLGDRDMRAGTVFGDTIPYQRYRAWQMAGRTVGLVGLGAVGRAAKWRFEGLGMKVITHDPYQPDADCELDELLATADMVSMHAPVNPETEGMIGAEQFSAMRPGAIYVNTARAALHDTDALVEALTSGHLGGAGLDHVQGEILPPDHPLTTLDNVVLTPHVGGATYDTEVNQTDMVVEDICRLLAGERPHRLANPEVWQ